MKHKTEATVQDAAQLEIQELGGVLWRNNIGVDRSSVRPVRYGLCNDSKQLNAVCKSSDLIGIVPVVVTADMVGKTLGVFVAVEAKKPGWTMGSDKHTVAQGNFIIEVIKKGGIGCFVNSVGGLVPYIKSQIGC